MSRLTGGVVFIFLQRPMSWQGIQQYQQLIPHLGEGSNRSATAMDLEFDLEASRAKQVGDKRFHWHQPHSIKAIDILQRRLFMQIWKNVHCS